MLAAGSVGGVHRDERHSGIADVGVGRRVAYPNRPETVSGNDSEPRAHRRWHASGGAVPAHSTAGRALQAKVQLRPVRNIGGRSVDRSVDGQCAVVGM